jgi:glutamyl-tRNA synthetase
MMPLRIALTASKVSPPLVGSIIALGEKEALLRLEKSIALLSC